MREFINDIGCSMSFDDKISDEQIEVRLGIFGNSKWREVKDE